MEKPNVPINRKTEHRPISNPQNRIREFDPNQIITYIQNKDTKVNKYYNISIIKNNITGIMSKMTSFQRDHFKKSILQIFLQENSFAVSENICDLIILMIKIEYVSVGWKELYPFLVRSSLSNKSVVIKGTIQILNKMIRNYPAQMADEFETLTKICIKNMFKTKTFIDAIKMLPQMIELADIVDNTNYMNDFFNFVFLCLLNKIKQVKKFTHIIELKLDAVFEILYEFIDSKLCLFEKHQNELFQNLFNLITLTPQNTINDCQCIVYMQVSDFLWKILDDDKLQFLEESNIMSLISICLKINVVYTANESFKSANRSLDVIKKCSKQKPIILNKIIHILSTMHKFTKLLDIFAVMRTMNYIHSVFTKSSYCPEVIQILNEAGNIITEYESFSLPKNEDSFRNIKRTFWKQKIFLETIELINNYSAVLVRLGKVPILENVILNLLERPSKFSETFNESISKLIMKNLFIFNRETEVRLIVYIKKSYNSFSNNINDSQFREAFYEQITFFSKGIIIAIEHYLLLKENLEFDEEATKCKQRVIKSFCNNVMADSAKVFDLLNEEKGVSKIRVESFLDETLKIMSDINEILENVSFLDYKFHIQFFKVAVDKIIKDEPINRYLKYLTKVLEKLETRQTSQIKDTLKKMFFNILQYFNKSFAGTTGQSQGTGLDNAQNDTMLIMSLATLNREEIDLYFNEKLFAGEHLSTLMSAFNLIQILLDLTGNELTRYIESIFRNVYKFDCIKNWNFKIVYKGLLFNLIENYLGLIYQNQKKKTTSRRNIKRKICKDNDSKFLLKIVDNIYNSLKDELNEMVVVYVVSRTIFLLNLKEMQTFNNQTMWDYLEGKVHRLLCIFLEGKFKSYLKLKEKQQIEYSSNYFQNEKFLIYNSVLYELVITLLTLNSNKYDDAQSVLNILHQKLFSRQTQSIREELMLFNVFADMSKMKAKLARDEVYLTIADKLIIFLRDDGLSINLKVNALGCYLKLIESDQIDLSSKAEEAWEVMTHLMEDKKQNNKLLKNLVKKIGIAMLKKFAYKENFVKKRKALKIFCDTEEGIIYKNFSELVDKISENARWNK